MIRRPFILFGALGLCALPACASRAAQPDPAEPAAASKPAISDNGHALSGLSAAQLFQIADQARKAGRPQDAEAIYKALAHDPKVEIRSEARFRLGMMYAQEKRYTDAALAFRAILDEQPKAARVRLELARVLALMGDTSGARKQLRQAQATGLPPQVAQAVNQFSNALRSHKTFGGSFEAAMAPDSNINRATDAKTLDTVIAPLTLSDDARAQSGIGARLSGQLYARLRVSPRLAIVPRISGDGTFYRQSQFDDVSGSALIGLEWQAGKSRITPSAGVTLRYYGGRPYARTENGDIHWIRQLDRRTQIDTSFSFGVSTYFRNHDQDGNLYSLGTSVEHALSARAGIGFSLNGFRQAARYPGYATASGGGTLLGWRDMGKITLFANVTARRLESDAPPPLFDVRRKEWYLRGSIGATFRQIEVAGFSPVLRMSYERNFANIALYDYKRFNINVGITRAF